MSPASRSPQWLGALGKTQAGMALQGMGREGPGLLWCLPAAPLMLGPWRASLWALLAEGLWGPWSHWLEREGILADGGRRLPELEQG